MILDFIPYLNPKDGSLMHYKCARCDEIVLEENKPTHKCKPAQLAPSEIEKLMADQEAQTEAALAGLREYYRLKEKERNPLGVNKRAWLPRFYARLHAIGWLGPGYGFMPWLTPAGSAPFRNTRLNNK